MRQNIKKLLTLVAVCLVAMPSSLLVPDASIVDACCKGSIKAAPMSKGASASRLASHSVSRASPRNARPTVASSRTRSRATQPRAIPQSRQSASRFVSVRGGPVVPVPRAWKPRLANNKQGLVYQRPGARGNADMVRIMDPNPRNPHGYVVKTNRWGQPLTAAGKPGPQRSPETHISLKPRTTSGR